MPQQNTVIHNSNNVLVFDEPTADGISRNMVLGPDFKFRQGAMLLDQPDKLCLEYYRNLFAGVTQARQLKRFLILGLGTGAIPKAIRSVYGEQVDIDLVDINPDVFGIAIRHYMLKPQENRCFVIDASQFILAQLHPYDHICVDIWDDTGVPPWMLTEPFWQRILELCASGGTVSVNVPAQLHHALSHLLTRMNPYVVSLKGHNAAFILPKDIPFRELSGDRLPEKLLARCLALGVDLSEIWRQSHVLCSSAKASTVLG